MAESTNSALSIASQEFLWNSAEAPYAHRYLIHPTIKILRELSARTVLDIGCGNGSFPALLRSQGVAVVGCDASASGVSLARKAHPEVDFFEHDISNSLPSTNAGPFYSVVSLEVVERRFQPRHLVDSAFKALSQGCSSIMSTLYHGYWKNLALALTNHFDEHWHPCVISGTSNSFLVRLWKLLFERPGFSVKSFLSVGRFPVFACSMILVAIKPE